MTEREKASEHLNQGGGDRRTLAFIDHHRQRYADRVTIPCDAEFLIGDYRDRGGVGDLGEFKVQLHYLGDRRQVLYPQLSVFGDGAAALAVLVEVAEGDLGAVLQPVANREEFASRLVAFGLRDASDEPPAEGR
ncbi:MAG: hypothetical protein AB7V58_00020 [Solirubrobacterales bacterium]